MLSVPIGPFRPDTADTEGGASSNVANALVINDGAGTVAYSPLPGTVALGTAVLGADVKGQFTAITAGGGYRVYVFTTTTIYQVGSDGAYTSIGTGYNLPAGDVWGACQFGTKLIVTNRNDGMLQYDVETGGAVTAISGAPKARAAKVIFDVLFALDCDGDARLMRNSDFVYTNWSTGVSGYQSIPEGRELLGIEELADGLAVLVQRSAVRMLTRRADQSLYDLRLLSSTQGATCPQSIVKANGELYFYDSNGFKRVTGSGVEAIGVGKVNNWFVDLIGATNQNNVIGGFDPTLEIVRFVVLNDTNGYGVDYHARFNEFVPFVDATVAAVFTTASPGYTMEDLDAFGTMDTITTSLDDRFFYGGNPQLGAICSGIYKVFSGASYAATFETNTFNSPRTQLITDVLPNTDSANITVEVGYSDTLSTALTYTAAASKQASGRVPVRARGKNFSLRADIPAGDTWSYFRGFDDVVMRQGGVR